VIVEELAATLGLNVDALSFTKAILLADGLKLSLSAVADTVKNVARALVNTVTETAEYGGQLKDMSERTGISTDALQEMRFAAERAGAPFGALTNGVKKLQMASVSAAGGNKAYSAIFRELGVSLKDGNGKLKTGEVLMYEVSAAMGQLTDDSKRTQVAQRLFGMGGQALIPILKGGENGLAAQAARFREMGIALDSGTIGSADDFGDAMFDLNAVLATFKRDIGGPMLKPLTILIDRVRGFVLRIRDLKKLNLDKYLERAKWALMGVGSVMLAMVLPSIVATAAALWAKVAAMAAVATWYAALGVQALLTGQLGLAAAMMPILGWLALGAVIALVAEDLYQFFTGGESLIGEFLEGPWLRFKDSMAELWVNLGRMAKLFFDDVKKWATEKIDWILAKFSALKQAIVEFVEALPGGRMAMELLTKGPVVGGASAVAGMFGSGASPTASAASSSQVSNSSNSFRARINVSSPSADPREVAEATKDAFWQSYNSELSAAAVAAEGT
jgi:hypothetical protein